MTFLPSQCCHQSEQHMGKLFICAKSKERVSVLTGISNQPDSICGQVKPEKGNLLQDICNVTTEAFKQRQYCCKIVRLCIFLKLVASKLSGNTPSVSSSPDREIVNISGYLIKYGRQNLRCMWKANFFILY